MHVLKLPKVTKQQTGYFFWELYSVQTNFWQILKFPCYNFLEKQKREQSKDDKWVKWERSREIKYNATDNNF